jgi:hypothetical protein
MSERCDSHDLEAVVVLAHHSHERITQLANEHYGRTTHTAYIGMFWEYLTALTADPIGTLKLARDVPLASGRDAQAPIEAAEVDAYSASIPMVRAGVPRHEHKVARLWTRRRPARYRS